MLLGVFKVMLKRAADPLWKSREKQANVVKALQSERCEASGFVDMRRVQRVLGPVREDGLQRAMS
eukprot:4291898-Alexandrium_andersonii.AAC.1